jgi:hypothetical protein
MRRVLPVAALSTTAAMIMGCGAPSADLFVVTRSGSIPGARLTMLVGDGGTVRCNGGPEHELTSKQLIDARKITFELNGDDQDPGPATRNVRLPAGPVTILRYVVRSEKGTVAFSDTSSRQPPAFYKVAKLTRDLAKGPCGLPR